MKHQALVAAHAAVTHAHTSPQEVRIYVVVGLLTFAVIGLIYEAFVKKQPHDFKLALGAMIGMGILATEYFSEAVKIYVVAGIMFCIVLYLLPHGLAKRQPGEVFVALVVGFAFAILTAPQHYLLPYLTGSVN